VLGAARVELFGAQVLVSVDVWFSGVVYITTQTARVRKTLPGVVCVPIATSRACLRMTGGSFVLLPACLNTLRAWFVALVIVQEPT
jgi:hypothetical protein